VGAVAEVSVDLNNSLHFSAETKEEATVKLCYIAIFVPIFSWQIIGSMIPH
jgi:hypothetical protein